MSNSYFFSNERHRINRDLVHRWLSEESYWAAGRPRATQEKAIDASLNYGVWCEDTGAQVAYARVVSDGATFAWLCDVFVASDARGEGVGKLLLAGIISDLEPLELPRTLLATADAHGLYEQYGFDPLPDSSLFMARLQS